MPIQAYGLLIGILSVIATIVTIREMLEPNKDVHYGIFDFVFVVIVQILDIVCMLIIVPVYAFWGFVPVWLAVCCVVFTISVLRRIYLTYNILDPVSRITDQNIGLQNGTIKMDDSEKDPIYIAESVIHIILEFGIFMYAMALIRGV